METAGIHANRGIAAPSARERGSNISPRIWRKIFGPHSLRGCESRVQANEVSKLRPGAPCAGPVHVLWAKTWYAISCSSIWNLHAKSLELCLGINPDSDEQVHIALTRVQSRFPYSGQRPHGVAYALRAALLRSTSLWSGSFVLTHWRFASCSQLRIDSRPDGGGSAGS